MSNPNPPYQNLQHTQKAFEAMNILRNRNILCDVTLVINKHEISAHKMVLAACSPYFCAMFLNFNESKADKITIQGMDGQTLQLLVDYVYSAEIQITEENVQILLPAASLLQLTDVRDACCEFLQGQLNPTNCLGIRAFADLHSCTELFEQAESYIEQNFSTLSASEDFLSLSLVDASKLLSKDKLTVSEEVVFEAAMSWVNKDLPNREGFLSQLMENVRLPLLSREYILQRVYNEPLLKSNSVCRDFIMEAMYCHLKREQNVMHQTPQTKPRTGRPKMLLVAGGYANKYIRSVECYDLKEGKWSQLTELPTSRTEAGLAVLNGLVYHVGGTDGSQRLNTVDVYDPQRDQWSQAPSMQVRRCGLGVAVLNSCIFAVGGQDGSTDLNSAECFNLKTNKWQVIAPMSTARYGVGVAVLNGLLYAVGGRDTSSEMLSSVECYNPETDTWSLVSKMSKKRRGAGVGVLEGILYAIGGYDGQSDMHSAECYNSETNSWVSIADMKIGRRGAGVVAVDGNLYVIGGYDGSAYLSSVEIYCPKTGTWSMLATDMTIRHSYPGVALLDKPM